MNSLKVLFSLLFLICLQVFKSLGQNSDTLNNYTIAKGKEEEIFLKTKLYNKANGLLSNYITAIRQDPSGYLWFASNMGISRFDGNTFTEYTINSKHDPTFISEIYPTLDSLLIGTPTSFILQSAKDLKQIDDKGIHCISKIAETFYLGTNKGIYKMKDGFIAALRLHYKIDLAQINDIKYDEKHYWIATQEALWKIDNIEEPSTIKKIKDGVFTDILITKNKILATSKNSGLIIYKDEKLFTVPVTTKNILGIREINKRFWLFSNTNGIEILNNNLSFHRKITKYNTRISNAITDVFQDMQKNIWIGTKNNGILKYENKNEAIPQRPIVRFENIEVVFESLDSININTYQNTLQLPYDKNHLAFSFNSIDINHPETILYRYGFGKEYSPWSSKKMVNLIDLKPGDYTFSVQSKTSFTKNSKPLQFHFVIAQPWYDRWWVRMLFILLLASVILIVIARYAKNIRTKNRKEIEQLKLKNKLLTLEQKALQLQMNPHFIFNILNSIKAQGKLGKTKDLESTITTFSSLLRGILHSSRKEEVALQTELKTLENYIILEQQISAIPFKYTIETNLSIASEEIIVPPMLLQPFVENSIKHGINGTSGSIRIYVYDKDNYLHCEIYDNGIGIVTAQKKKKGNDHNSIAIEVTKTRIESLGSTATLHLNEIIENGIVKGTKVWFKIPLKTDF
ncbi:histidine kinase [Tenacibaculum sp. SG-28]|uniref:sensor histidine kinase n=1 Tax=Tenacibaculum sp. SG-28 TaxID=754426 RepID=UPI000CF4DFD5|nr:histidine kinase [Tenacibaculum sp. SG-28]PQJ19685.1 hypothetical protein BSU00_11980 [Tenacibaculum sp. SG-28]